MVCQLVVSARTSRIFFGLRIETLVLSTELRLRMIKGTEESRPRLTLDELGNTTVHKSPWLAALLV